MKRLMIMAVGLTMAAVPAVFGLADNPSLSHSVAVRIPSGAKMVTASQFGNASRVGHGTATSGQATSGPSGPSGPSGMGGQATSGPSGMGGQATSGPSGMGGQATSGASGKDGQATPTTSDTSGKGGRTTPATTPSPGKGPNPAPEPGMSVSGPVATRGGGSGGGR